MPSLWTDEDRRLPLDRRRPARRRHAGARAARRRARPPGAADVQPSRLVVARRGSFGRVQFTPDLVPSDHVGTRIWRLDHGAFRRAAAPSVSHGRWLRGDGRRRRAMRQACAAMSALDRRELAAIFAGGFLGAVARVALSQWFPQSPAGWPWATFIVNVAGTFVLGYFATRLQERLPVSVYRRPLLGTGFCGALTTFSAVQIELLVMLDAGRPGLAVAYAATTVVAGLAAVRSATGMVRRVRALA